MKLPDGNVVDILSTVIAEILEWVQDEPNKPEGGGYIVGYQHNRTGNISLEEASHPYPMDIRTVVHFDIKDPRHNVFLKKAKRRKSYYMGVWHTHPQKIPTPSSIDWEDWNETMRIDTTGSKYIFFIIVGTEEVRVWAGDSETKRIDELFECEKNKAGLYTKSKEEEK